MPRPDSRVDSRGLRESSRKNKSRRGGHGEKPGESGGKASPRRTNGGPYLIFVRAGRTEVDLPGRLNENIFSMPGSWADGPRRHPNQYETSKRVIRQPGPSMMAGRENFGGKSRQGRFIPNGPGGEVHTIFVRKVFLSNRVTLSPNGGDFVTNISPPRTGPPDRRFLLHFGETGASLPGGRPFCLEKGEKKKTCKNAARPKLGGSREKRKKNGKIFPGGGGRKLLFYGEDMYTGIEPTMENFPHSIPPVRQDFGCGDASAGMQTAPSTWSGAPQGEKQKVVFVCPGVGSGRANRSPPR